jgi:uncharacterized membrane protein YccC
MASDLFSRMRSLLRNAWRLLQDPARRYRHARLIHATRVAFAVLASIVLTTGIQLPHGAWATITVLVVIGGLQHHGNIRRKSAERALGTFIGAAVGLAVIAQQSWLHIPLISYALILVACGVCAYQAIGKGGYIALLSAITIVIVAGHGDNAIADGLWRAVNVLIGTAIALLFSFALPLYATYSWRAKLAEALRACAGLYGKIADCGALDRVALQKVMVAQGALLIQLRSLMPSVASEIKVSTEQLEAIQHRLRISISLLEVLATIRPAVDDADAKAFIESHLASEHRRVARMLKDMARALKFGTIARLAPHGVVAPELSISANATSAQLAGYVSLMLRLSSEFEELRARLAAIADHWNI